MNKILTGGAFVVAGLAVASAVQSIRLAIITRRITKSTEEELHLLKEKERLETQKRSLERDIEKLKEEWVDEAANKSWNDLTTSVKQLLKEFEIEGTV